MIVFVILSILSVLISVFYVTNATIGVWIIGIACYLGILARLVQASDHQRVIKKLLEEISPYEDEK